MKPQVFDADKYQYGGDVYMSGSVLELILRTETSKRGLPSVYLFSMCVLVFVGSVLELMLTTEASKSGLPSVSDLLRHP